jgi:acyl-[acyl carrier protein]--UDP-N-acetylglucosamine O-acyltransferase
VIKKGMKILRRNWRGIYRHNSRYQKKKKKKLENAENDKEIKEL